MKEAAIFKANLEVLDKIPPIKARVILTQLLNATDLSSLPDLDDPTYRKLIHLLKADDDLVRRSARYYITFSLIKNKTNQFVTRLIEFLLSQRSDSLQSFLKVLDAIDLLDDEEDFSLCCQLLSVFPHSELKMGSLEFRQRSDLAKKRLPQLFNALQELSSLSFSFFLGRASPKFSNEHWKTFCKLITSLPKLSELYLDRSNLSHLDVEGWWILGELFASIPGLSRLSLNYSQFFSNADGEAQWTAFCQAISRATHLVSLDVSHIRHKVKDDFNALEIFCNAVSGLDQLESLNLSACNLNSAHATEWQHLRKLFRLSTLDLSLNRFDLISPEGWGALCTALISLPSLTSLSLSNNFLRLSNEYLEVLAPIFVSLQHLSLQGMSNDPDWMPAEKMKLLFQNIQRSNLISLNISIHPCFLMKLDDVSFDIFCQAIVDAKYLSEINLSDTFQGLNKERYEKLCNAIFDAKQLTSVDLKGIQLDEASWRFFWNGFNKARHISTISLTCPWPHNATTRKEWNAFIEGISQARHVSSFGLFHITNDVKDQGILWGALEPLFNLVELKSDFIMFPHHIPRVVKLLERNNALSQFRVDVKEVTTELNSTDKEQKSAQVKYVVSTMVKAVSDLLETLPDHPDFQVFREEVSLLLNDFYFAAARWFARNNEARQAINCFTLIPFGSLHFTKARVNAFIIAFEAYRNDRNTATQAFPKALPLCLEGNRFILLDAEFQSTFDGFLLHAIGLAKTLELIPKVTQQLRIKMLKYLSLFVLKDELLNTKSAEQTHFFLKIALPQVFMNILAECRLLNTFEQLAALDVDVLWINAKLEYDTVGVAFELYNLLCQVIKQLEGAPKLAEQSQFSSRLDGPL